MSDDSDLINHAAIDICYEMLCAMLNESASEVEASASALSDNFRSLAAATSEQGGVLDRVVRTVNQLQHKDGHITLEKFIEMMGYNISDTIDKIVTISENAMSLSFVMEKVIDELHGIERFIEQVNKINNQTRMLALNATIEAARAGSAGAGFGVVANEVKQVSQQIDGMAKAMQLQISTISQSLESGRETLGKAAGIDMSGNITARTELDALMKALLSKNNELSKIMQLSAKSVKEISSEIGNITIGVQFQDRNSQIINSIVQLIYAMRLHEKTPEKNPLPKDTGQALEKISSVINLSAVRQRLFATAHHRGVAVSQYDPTVQTANASVLVDEVELF